MYYQVNNFQIANPILYFIKFWFFKLLARTSKHEMQKVLSTGLSSPGYCSSTTWLIGRGGPLLHVDINRLVISISMFSYVYNVYLCVVEFSQA